jgi:hypothetical protein
MHGFFCGPQGLRNRWEEGTEQYHWHVLPQEDFARLCLFDPYLNLVDRDGLEPVHPASMHIAVLRYAPAAEITAAELRSAVRAVRDRCEDIEPFEVRIRRPELWGNAVVCPVSGQPVRRLREAAVDAAREATGSRWDLPGGYYAHLTLAYATGDSDDGPMREWMSGSDIAEPDMRVDTLTLVRQKWAGNHFTWEICEGIPLGNRKRM